MAFPMSFRVLCKALSQPQTTMRIALGCFLAVLIFTLTNAPLARAQAVGAGQMQGIVTDPTGAPVASATVEALQTDSGLRRDVTTGQTGEYLLPNLPVGPYQLKVTKASFETYTQSGIVLEVGNNLRVDVQLKVGGASETVQVTSEASMVQTEDQAVSQVIDKQRVIDLPLNGRQATQLILLTAATAVAPNGDNVGSRTTLLKSRTPSRAARAPKPIT